MPGHNEPREGANTDATMTQIMRFPLSCQAAIACYFAYPSGTLRKRKGETLLFPKWGRT
jgi:hypothetical protein